MAKSIKDINELLKKNKEAISVEKKQPGSWYEYTATIDGKPVDFACKSPKEEMYQTIASGGFDAFLKTKCVVTNQTTDDDLPEIQESLEQAVDFIDLMRKKVGTSLILAGPRGIGKTETVLRYCDKHNIDPVYVKGYSTAFGLYQKLANNQDAFIIFDDCDSIFDDAVGLNVLKAALEDNGRPRKISWNAAGQDVEEFEFKGTIVFVSNLNYYAVKRNVKHIEAVMDRIYFVQCSSMREKILRYIETIAKEIQPDKKIRELIFDKITAESKGAISIRLFEQLNNIYANRKDKFDSLAGAIIRARRIAA